MAAEALISHNSDEVWSVATYDAVLDALQFWVQFASQNEDLYDAEVTGEKHFQKLFEYRRSKSAKFLPLGGHTNWVHSVAFSPDGSYIVSGSNDYFLRVWDSQTWSNTAVLEGHEDSVLSVALSPDGSRIVSGSSDHTVRVWDSRTGASVAIFREHTDNV
jgi:WD40 repeat protein